MTEKVSRYIPKRAGIEPFEHDYYANSTLWKNLSSAGFHLELTRAGYISAKECSRLSDFINENIKNFAICCPEGTDEAMVNLSVDDVLGGRRPQRGEPITILRDNHDEEDEPEAQYEWNETYIHIDDFKSGDTQLPFLGELLEALARFMAVCEGAKAEGL